VLTSRNLHGAVPPAITVKILTALVAVERLPPKAMISVNPNDAGRECMCIGLKPGQSWPFDQAMASMMMVSANDAAYAIAETAGGSIPGFAAELNATAKRYGMRDSTFGDPAGLDDGTSYEGGPKVSAYDLSIAARNALTVPAIARWAATRTYQFTDVAGTSHTLTNHNNFLPGGTFGYRGANGFKTGFTQRAGHTLVATATRDGRQLIVVILGAVDSGYTWAASLLEQGFATPPTTIGTGLRLPPVAVSPYGTRLAQRSGFFRLASGAAATALVAAPTSTPDSSATPAPSATTNPATAHHSGGLLAASNIALALLAALVACVFLRRRAVKRQRARRIERRARAKAMRSGSLPVVDGRYRTGTRVGPPVDSRVRVKRAAIDLTKESVPQSTSRGAARRRP
jgi:D-alanyl-D-alanine carboxypeptidase